MKTHQKFIVKTTNPTKYWNKTVVGSIDQWPANLWSDFSPSKANEQCYEPRDPIKKILTQHVIISTRNCVMELRTGNWIGVTIMHPRTFANGGSIKIFYMTEIQHLLSVHHILFLPISVSFELATFLFNSPDLMAHHILILFWEGTIFRTSVIPHRTAALRRKRLIADHYFITATNLLQERHN